MKDLLLDTQGVSLIVASLMLIIVVAVSVAAVSFILRDLGFQTNDLLAKGSVADTASIRVEIVGTENTSNLTDNLVREYNKLHNGIVAKSYTGTINYTSDGVLSSIDEKVVDIGILDKDQNASTPNLDNYNINYYEIGARNDTIDPAIGINITRIYIASNLAPSALIQNFVDWVRSPDGQKIVNNSGYISHLQELNGVLV